MPFRPERLSRCLPVYPPDASWCLPDASRRLETGIAREFAELFFVVLAQSRRCLGGASAGAAVGDGRARKSYLPEFEVLYDVYEP